MTVTAAAVQLTTALTLLLTLLVLAQDGDHLEGATNNLLELATDEGSINANSQDQLTPHNEGSINSNFQDPLRSNEEGSINVNSQNQRRHQRKICTQTDNCREKEGLCQSKKHECEGKTFNGCKGKCVCCVPSQKLCPQMQTCTDKVGMCQSKNAMCKGKKSKSCTKGCICCIPPPCNQRRKCKRKRGKCQGKKAFCPGKKSKGCARGCICCEPESDVCKLPLDAGSCKKKKQKFYFNIETGQCEFFTYGGCEGNANRFDTYENCIRMCIKDDCLLPPKIGHCKAHKPRFYYSSSSGKCMDFPYGGCKGNANRFTTETDCIQTCIKGMGCNHPSVRKIQRMFNKVKKDVENHLNRTLEDFTVMGYKIMGTTYFAEVLISSTEYIYLRAHMVFPGRLNFHGLHINENIDGFVGAVSPEFCADKKIQMLLEMVKSKVEIKLKEHDIKMKKFKVVSYASQVVAGVNFYAKVLIRPRKYIHIRVSQDLSGNMILQEIEVDKTLSDPIK